MRPSTRRRHALPKFVMCAIAVVTWTLLAWVPVSAGPATVPTQSVPLSAAQFKSGADSDCAEWRILFDLLLFDFDIEIAEEGWVWANGTDTTDKFREASGVVTKSKVAHNDTPANHYSHDWNVDIRVDPGQEGLLSNVNGPNNEDDVDSEDDLVPAEKIEMEWETGVTPDETSGDGADPSLPRWALPNLGDRVWTDGHWVFDCGHAKNVDEVPHFRTEIHPGRAIASMRQQMQTLPGSGTTPVPVTATDLYVHGSGTFMVQQLECGIDVILQFIFTPCDVTTTPIDDLYSFEVCLPTKPVPWATLAMSMAPGPDDDGFATDPDIDDVTATGGCVLPVDEYGNDFDDGTMLEVTVDLRGSGITPDDVYSRRIVAGWVYPPAEPAPHVSLKLDQLDLEEDHEIDLPGVDAEMTFWWMGVDQAPTDEWHRLVNHEIPTVSDSIACPEHTNVLNDMDDDDLCGDGLLDFSGPTWDFYLGDDPSFTVHTSGFEQDCYDRHFGTGGFSIFDYVDCYAGSVFEATNDWGNNDPLPPLDHTFVDPLTLTWPQTIGDPDEFEFDLTLTEVPLTDEDTADLAVSKSCSFPGEVALAGDPFSCTIVVTNAGPGLPRNVVVTDAISTALDPSDYAVGAATFRVGSSDETNACGGSSSSGFSCEIGTVPVGGSVTIAVEVTPREPGRIADSAVVSTDSVDEVAGNDESSDEVDVHLPVPVDISPGSITNPVNLAKRGVISVAIITGPGFDATQLQVATACFGDSGNPSQRTCIESHGGPHVVDVDKDKDQDLLFHFDALATGIDLGDTTACLRGTTAGGIGFYGCDIVAPS